MDYARFESWLGAPYVWWKPGDEVFDTDEPFWTRDGPLPSPEEIRIKGCNCTGFLNLVLRTQGRRPLGGTGEWWETFEREPYDKTKTYPVGTLFLAKYVSPTDQGHVALQGPNGVLHSIPDGGLVCQNVPDWDFDAQVPPQKWIAAPGERGYYMLDYTFLYSLEGAPHGVATGHWSTTVGPHWGAPSFLPSTALVHHTGCTNAGVGNLARRSAGLSSIGSMGSWWGAFALSGDLYRSGTLYPMGTLFLRAYRGEDDPGHLGILTPRGVVHSTPERGVVFEPESDDWEMVVLPEQWLISS